MPWFVIKAIYESLMHKHVALFSNNSNSISWVDCMASQQLAVGAHFLQAFPLKLKLNKCCLINRLHMAGKQSLIADIASCSFGNPPQWHCTSDFHFAQLFNRLFPLPNQKGMKERWWLRRRRRRRRRGVIHP